MASTEIAGAYVQASGTNKSIIYTAASAPTIRVASDMRKQPPTWLLLLHCNLPRSRARPEPPKFEKTPDVPGADVLGRFACQNRPSDGKSGRRHIELANLFLDVIAARSLSTLSIGEVRSCSC